MQPGLCPPISQRRPPPSPSPGPPLTLTTKQIGCRPFIRALTLVPGSIYSLALVPRIISSPALKPELNHAPSHLLRLNPTSLRAHAAHGACRACGPQTRPCRFYPCITGQHQGWEDYALTIFSYMAVSMTTCKVITPTASSRHPGYSGPTSRPSSL